MRNIVCTLKWPSLEVKIGKEKKSKFGRIDSWSIYISIIFKAKKKIVNIIILQYILIRGLPNLS